MGRDVGDGASQRAEERTAAFVAGADQLPESAAAEPHRGDHQDGHGRVDDVDQGVRHECLVVEAPFERRQRGVDARNREAGGGAQQHEPEDDGQEDEGGPGGADVADQAAHDPRSRQALHRHGPNDGHHVARVDPAGAAHRAVVALVAEPRPRIGDELVLKTPLRHQHLPSREGRVGRRQLAHAGTGGALVAPGRVGAAPLDERLAELRRRMDDRNRGHAVPPRARSP